MRVTSGKLQAAAAIATTLLLTISGGFPSFAASDLTEGAAPLTTNGDGRAAPSPSAESLNEITVVGRRFRDTVSETSSKLPTPLVETPQAITVVNTDILQSIGAQSPIDVARYVSGVSANSNARTVRAELFSRGFALDAHKGYKLNGTNLVQATIPDIAVVERVEFVKGANSIAYGENPPGGFVNFIAKEPPKAAMGSAALTFGSYNRFRTDLDYGSPLNSAGTIRGRAVVAYERSDVYQQFASNKLSVGGLFLDADITDKDLLRTELIYQNKQATPSFGLAVFSNGSIPKLPVDFAEMQPWSHVNADFETVNASWQHSFESDLRLTFLANHQNTYVHGQTGTPVGDLAATDSIDPISHLTTARRGDVTLLASAVTEKSKTNQAEMRFGGDFEIGERRHSFIMTVEYLNQTFQQANPEFLVLNGDGTNYVFNYFHPLYNSIEPKFAFVGPTIPINSFSEKSYSSSAQTVIRPLDRVELTLGYRYDRIDSTTQSGDITTFTKYTDTAWTPRGAALFKLTKQINAYYSYSKSFIPNGTLDCAGKLQPSRQGKQNEVGLKGEFFDKALLLTGAVYSIDLTNLTVGDSCGGPGINRTRILGQQRHKGFELEVVGNITPAWNILASYSVVDANIVESTNPASINAGVSNIPRSRLGLLTSYEISVGILRGLGFGAGVTHEGPKQITVPPLENDIPAYTQWDAQIFYGRGPYRVTGVIANLTQAVGYDSIFGTGAIGIVRRPPRQASVSLIYKF